MSVSQEEITKALTMLKLLHPDSHDEVLVIISKLANDNNSLERTVEYLNTQVGLLRAEVATIKRNQDDAWNHTQASPKPV